MPNQLPSRGIILILSLLILTFGSQGSFADGFTLKWARKNDGPVELRLTKEQQAMVGVERRLVLTDAQKVRLKRYVRTVPNTLGVESLGEPDCSCHISSAMWTDTDIVTVWTRRLAYDSGGSKVYYEVRRKPGYFTMDASGQIYAIGRPLTWEQFVAELRKLARKDNRGQLSLPPYVPESLERKLDALPDKISPYHRL